MTEQEELNVFKESITDFFRNSPINNLYIDSKHDKTFSREINLLDT